jgi:TrmH family RNA methyltransferase
MSLDFSLVPDNKYILLPDPLFNALSETKTPQGILAVMKKSEVQFDNLFDNENMFVILDNIKDPGNMGTLIRTCNCAGVDRIFTSKGCVDIYNPKVLRSTMGSIFHIPIIKCEDLLSIIQQMKVKGISIYASSLNGSVNLYSIHFKDKICIVIGNEADGVDQEIQDLSDYLVRIPMKGSAESLNAGVAGGIIIYEAIRQKNFF